ncbi:hypothetical protein [Paraburkholderia sp.]|uniref:hypothetical protein n=1 Tax=Paraburkholderia sp. TaxID=1926495 RepID=UPI002F4172C6
MNALALRIVSTLAVVSMALASQFAHAQALATYGDAPAAEAAGAAAAANRGGNGGALNAGAGDASLLGAPNAYGDVYQAQTSLERRIPTAGANAQAQAATPNQRMLNNPDAPQAGGAARAGGARPANANGNVKATMLTEAPDTAAIQLYGNGTAKGSVHKDVYKQPW